MWISNTMDLCAVKFGIVPVLSAYGVGIEIRLFFFRIGFGKVNVAR